MQQLKQGRVHKRSWKNSAGMHLYKSRQDAQE